MFVMFRTCYLEGLLCLRSVMSSVYVQGLFCVGFVCQGLSNVLPAPLPVKGTYDGHELQVCLSYMLHWSTLQRAQHTCHTSHTSKHRKWNQNKFILSICWFYQHKNKLTYTNNTYKHTQILQKLFPKHKQTLIHATHYHIHFLVVRYGIELQL